MKVSRKGLIWKTVGVWLGAMASAWALSAPPGLLFYASFDGRPDQDFTPIEDYREGRPGEYPAADHALGHPLPEVARNVQRLEGEGRFGDAVKVTGVPGGSSRRRGASVLAFDALGNILTRRGTMAFWVRSEEPLWSGTYRGGRHPKITIVREAQIPTRAQNKFLNLGVNSFHRRLELQGFEEWSWFPGEEWAPGHWQHLAITWDAATGKRLYHNGQPVAVEDEPEFRSRWLDVINLGSHVGGGSQLHAVELSFSYDELYLFDYVLTEDQIRRLMRDNQPPSARNEPTEEDRRRNLRWIADKFGWDRPGVPLCPDGAVLQATRIPPSRVRSGRIDTSLPVDGKVATYWPHGYKDRLERRRLTLSFGPDREAFDYVRIRGSRHERRTAGEYEPGYAHVYFRRRPGGIEGRLEAGSSHAAFDGEYRVQCARFAEPVAVDDAVFVRHAPFLDFDLEERREGFEESLINQIDFYRLAEVPDRPLPEAWDLYLRPGAAVADDGIERSIRGAYPEEDRTLFDALPAAPEATRVALEAGQFVHWVTAPLPADRGLGALDLHLALEGFEGPVKASLQLHDPVTLRRVLVEFDFQFMGRGGPQDVRLRFDGLDYLIRQGSRLWLTLVMDRPGRVLCGPRGSRLTAAGRPAYDGKAALAGLEGMLSDNFLWISEPQPWRAGPAANRGGDPFRHIKVLGEIMEMAEHILHFDPENWTAQSIYSWIIMRGQRSWRPDVAARYRGKDPFAGLRPEDVVDEDERGDAPEWAFYGRKALRLERRIADWWVQDRMDPETGLLGGGAGDDSTLVTGFVNFALIHDPGQRLRDAIRRLADYTWRRMLDDGISSTVRSALHVYEQGTNIQHLLPRLFYGDPEAIARQLRTARHYDGHITDINPLGQRLRRSITFSATEIPGPDSPFYAPYDNGMARIYHPGRVLVWYNRHPRVLQLFREWTDTWLSFGVDDGIAPEVGNRARYFETGAPVEGVSAQSDQMASHLYWIYETTRDPRYLEALAAGRQAMRFPRWRLQDSSRDALLRSLQENMVHTRKYLPVSTWVGQSTDRIVVQDVPIARMYLGDSAQTNKRQGWHYHAVSWEDADEDISRFVIDQREDGLRVLLYSFHEESRTVTLRPWRLEHGRYRVRVGADTNRDDMIDLEDFSREQVLFRYEPVTFTVPPRVVYVLEIEQETAIPEAIEMRADLAVSARDVTVEGGAVRVRVHNLGSRAAPAAIVQLRGEGGVVAERTLPGLPGMTAYSVPSATVVFEGIGDPSGVKVVVDPEDRIPEITRYNNQVRL